MRLSVWKDRPNRVRIIALHDGEHEDARRYYYKQYHPTEDIKGYRILQLDMNPWNFDEDNLVKITPRIMNCLLNNHLLSDNPKLNKMAIQTLELEFMTKAAGEQMKGGKKNMNNIELICKILMCIGLVVFIIYNVHEIIASHKYYKSCNEAHKKYLEEIINDFKNKE